MNVIAAGIRTLYKLNSAERLVKSQHIDNVKLKQRDRQSHPPIRFGFMKDKSIIWS